MVESLTWCPAANVHRASLAPGLQLSTSPSSWADRGGWMLREQNQRWRWCFFKSVSNITFNLHSYQKNQRTLIPCKPLSSVILFVDSIFLPPGSPCPACSVCSTFYPEWFWVSALVTPVCFECSILVISAICYLGLSGSSPGGGCAFPLFKEEWSFCFPCVHHCYDVSSSRQNLLSCCHKKFEGLAWEECWCTALPPKVRQ